MVCQCQLEATNILIGVIVKNSSPHRQSADCCLSVSRLSTNTLPTVDRQIYLDFSEKDNCEEQLPSTDSRPTVCQQLADT